jgi:hypothetical protein
MWLESLTNACTSHTEAGISPEFTPIVGQCMEPEVEKDQQK